MVCFLALWNVPHSTQKHCSRFCSLLAIFHVVEQVIQILNLLLAKTVSSQSTQWFKTLYLMRKIRVFCVLECWTNLKKREHIEPKQWVSCWALKPHLSFAQMYNRTKGCCHHQHLLSLSWNKYYIAYIVQVLCTDVKMDPHKSILNTASQPVLHHLGSSSTSTNFFTF